VCTHRNVAQPPLAIHSPARSDGAGGSSLRRETAASVSEYAIVWWRHTIAGPVSIRSSSCGKYGSSCLLSGRDHSTRSSSMLVPILNVDGSSALTTQSQPTSRAKTRGCRRPPHRSPVGPLDTDQGCRHVATSHELLVANSINKAPVANTWGMCELGALLAASPP
jgi:hypothetical protein